MEKLVKNKLGQWDLKKAYDHKKDPEYDHWKGMLDRSRKAKDDEGVAFYHKGLEKYLKNDAVSKARYSPTGEKPKGKEPDTINLPSGHSLDRIGRWSASDDLPGTGSDTWAVNHPDHKEPVGYVQVNHGEHKVPNMATAGSWHELGSVSDHDENARLNADTVNAAAHKQIKDISHHIVPALTKHYGYLTVNNDPEHANIDHKAVKQADPSIDQFHNGNRNEYTYHKHGVVNHTKGMFGDGTFVVPEVDKEHPEKDLQSHILNKPAAPKKPTNLN